MFGPDEPLRFLNLNLTLGLTGLSFDQCTGDPDDVCDVQLCLEGREWVALEKRCSTRQDVGEVLAFHGAWPHYQVRFRSRKVELDLAYDAVLPVQHWARAGRLYSHYTCFGRCRGTWRRDHARGTFDTPALLDHGFGRRARGFGRLLRRFRYEVLRLPDGAFAIGLVTELPGGVTLRRAGLLRGEAARYEHEIIQSERFANVAGASRAVPAAWAARVGPLAYHARRSTPPRAVLGDGFLYAFDYDTADFSGEGYAEQLGTHGG